jgi:hypothetical protein
MFSPAKPVFGKQARPSEIAAGVFAVPGRDSAFRPVTIPHSARLRFRIPPGRGPVARMSGNSSAADANDQVFTGQSGATIFPYISLRTCARPV